MEEEIKNPELKLLKEKIVEALHYYFAHETVDVTLEDHGCPACGDKLCIILVSRVFDYMEKDKAVAFLTYVVKNRIGEDNMKFISRIDPWGVGVLK